MQNLLLKEFLYKELGDSHTSNEKDSVYHCPFCNHHKRKLSIDLTENSTGENRWQCWVCGTKGRSLITLFKKLKKFSSVKSQLLPLLKIDTYNNSETQREEIKLPDGFQLLSSNTSLEARHIKKYLKDRGLSDDDIFKYKVGFTNIGEWRDYAIFPSYNDSGQLNYFLGRNIRSWARIKYKLPNASKNIIFNELFINWNLPIFICEGVFDAMAIKRNAIPILGKEIPEALYKKIITSEVDKIVIVLDMDALDRSLKYCEMFKGWGIDTYFIKTGDKDPSELGFENFLKLLPNIKPITEEEILKEKLMSI